MLKRIAMIAASAAAAVILTVMLPVLFTAWAAEAPANSYKCNVSSAVQCSIVQSPPLTNTTLTTTHIPTSALPTSITIRITTTAPIAAFDFAFAADYSAGSVFVPATAQTETNRTARITIPLATVGIGSSQTKVSLIIYSSVTDIIEENLIINHPPSLINLTPTPSTTPTSTPSTTPTPTPSTTPTSTPSTTPTPTPSTTPRPSITPSIPRNYFVTIPIAYNIYCYLFGESCFGSNDTIEDAPEIKLESLLAQYFHGTLNILNDPRDYFRVAITDTKPYTISIINPATTAPGGDLDLALYDAAKTLVCQSSFTGTSNEQIKINVLPCSNSLTFSQTKILPGSYTLLVKYGYLGLPINHTVPYTLTIKTR